jgi:hypothetical protein
MTDHRAIKPVGAVACIAGLLHMAEHANLAVTFFKQCGHGATRIALWSSRSCWLPEFPSMSSNRILHFDLLSITVTSNSAILIDELV